MPEGRGMTRVDDDLRRSARIAIVAALAVIASFIASKAARDAIILSEFGIENLPLFVGISAALSLPVVLVAGRLIARLGPDRLMPWLNLASAGLLVGEWVLMHSAPRATAVLVFLHLGSLGAVLVSGFWSIINERFDVQTGKRHIGRIGVGATIGGVLGGVIAERTAVYLEPGAILIVLAGLQLVCGIALRVLAADEAPRDQRVVEGEVARLSALRTIATTPLLRNLAVIVVFGAIAAAALDFVFKAEVMAATSNGGPLRMFALYHTGTSVLTALVQIALAQLALTRLGVARTVATLPLTVSSFGLAALVSPGLYSAMIARGAEAVTRSSVYRAGYELLFAPLPEADKRSTKVVLDVGAERIGDLLGAQLIAVLIWFSAPPESIPVAAVVAGTIALMFAMVVPRSYTSALEHSLVVRAKEEGNTTPPPVPKRHSPLMWTQLGQPTMSETGADMTALSLLDLRPARGPTDPAASRPVVHEVVVPAAKPPRAALTASTASTASTVDDGARSAPAAGGNVTDVVVDRIAGLRSGQLARVRKALDRGPLTPDLVPHVLPLVAWDEIAAAALTALEKVAARSTGVLVDALLDPDREFAVRRRLPAIMTAGEPALAAWGLWRGLADRRFEVRYRCGLALVELRAAGHAMPFGEEAVHALVDRELSVESQVLRSYRLLDSDFPFVDGVKVAVDKALHRIVDRTSSTAVAHVFNLLGLALPPEPIRIAFQGLHTEDRELRATALEYLESALPPEIWGRLRPLIDAEREREKAEAAKPKRTREELVAALTLSQPAIQEKLRATAERRGEK
jgi:ATP:ADP antiporter, AAA family